jgi:hypothetical protein
MTIESHLPPHPNPLPQGEREHVVLVAKLYATCFSYTYLSRYSAKPSAVAAIRA